MNAWKSVLELDSDRVVVAGSEDALRSAIGRGADLRIYTEFRHNEHIEPGADNSEMVWEVSDFRVTYLVEDRWVADIMNLRMPIRLLAQAVACDPSSCEFEPGGQVGEQGGELRQSIEHEERYRVL